MLNRGVLSLASLVLMTLAVYSPSMRAGWIWDDDDYVTNNRSVKSADGLGRIWLDPHASPQYYPLVFTTFWVEHQFWGLAPGGYHLVNILLHAANAVLLWRVLATLRVPGAWLAAALFGLHPVQAESVAWVTERKNVLSGLFTLAALLAYLRFDPLEGPPIIRARLRWPYYGLAVGLFVLALLSKTVTAVLPAVILVLIWWKRGRLGRRDLVAMIPLIVLGAAMGLMTAGLERNQVGAEGEDWNLDALQRVLLAGRAVWFYAGKLLWPAGLTFSYPRWEPRTWVWWQWLYPLGLAAALVGLWLGRRRLGRGPLAAELIFCGALVPALGFFNVYPHRFSFVADHFQYHASMALLALIAAAGTLGMRWVLARLESRAPGRTGRLGDNWLGRSGWAWPRVTVAAALLASLGATSWLAQAKYRNPESLWQDTLVHNSRSWLACNWLGVIRAAQADAEQTGPRQRELREEAIALYRRALRLRPNFPLALNNLGVALAARGESRDGSARQEDREAAMRHIDLAIELRPDYAGAHLNRAVLLDAMGRRDEAIAECWTALQLGAPPEIAKRFLAMALQRQQP